MNSSQLGNVVHSKVLSNFTLEVLRQRYTTNYDDLKNSFGLLPTADFSIISNNYLLERRTPDQTKVIAGAYRKQVLNSNGDLETKDFIIKVW